MTAGKDRQPQPHKKMAIKLKRTSQAAAMTFKKIAIHGRAGIGKTMLFATAAPYKPLVIFTEKTGEESLQPEAIAKIHGSGRSDILYDVDYIEAYTPEDFQAAVQYAMTSDHDLIGFDSFSKASRLILKHAKTEHAHGLKAYGQHNDVAIDLIESLMAQDKHVIAICHTSRQQDGESGEVLYQPSFEGKGFGEKFTYELAHILHMELAFDDEGVAHRVLRCHQGESDKLAKNRGGLLSELEPAHLGHIIQKLSGTSPQKKSRVK
jgi:hypothetical protein